MSPSLQFMLVLAILIAAAKLGGLLSRRLHQPAVLGELFVGLLLGPTVFNVLHLPIFTDEHLGQGVQHVAEIGVIMLMFFAGMEINLDDMLASGRVATLVGTMGVIVPLVLGALVALPFGYPLEKALFIGIILTATSVSISAQTLMELGLLRSLPGLTLLGAAVVDDVLGILVLSLFLALAAGAAGAAGVGIVVLKMGLFLLVAGVLAFRVLPRLADWVGELPVSEGVLALTLVVALLFAVAAETLGGIAAITGAFIAGLGLARSDLKPELEAKVSAVSYGFFVPIFFVSIGLLANGRAIPLNLLPFVVLICLAAIVSKVVGCGLGGLAGGFTPLQSLQVGTGMISRGEVGLIVATVGITNGIIGNEVFTVAVLVVLVTTLVTPPLLRLVFRLEVPPAPTHGEEEEREDAEVRVVRSQQPQPVD